MKALTFQNITLTPVRTDSQIWLTSGELAKALNYADQSSVNKIYDRNADEFSDSMTALIPNPQMKNAKIRIFSLKGCHLIAMFARTAVAKQFRQWVLDILDKEVGQPTIQKTTVDERIPLKNAVNLLVAKGSLNYSECYKLVHQYMGVNHIDEIPLDDLPKAVEYVHHLILQIGKSPLDDKSEYNAFWRMVGVLEYDRISHELRNLQSTLDTAQRQLNRITKTKGLLYDAFGEQRHISHDPNIVVNAQAFIDRQMAMKTRFL